VKLTLRPRNPKETYQNQCQATGCEETENLVNVLFLERKSGQFAHLRGTMLCATHRAVFAALPTNTQVDVVADGLDLNVANIVAGNHSDLIIETTKIQIEKEEEPAAEEEEEKQHAEPVIPVDFKMF